MNVTIIQFSYSCKKVDYLLNGLTLKKIDVYSSVVAFVCRLGRKERE